MKEMKRENEFVKNTAILAVGKYFPKLFSFITLPIITGQLTKAEYGTYDLITTLVSLLLPVVTLQIQSAAFRFLIDCRGDDEDSSKIISNIFFFTVITSLITVIIFFLVYGEVSILTKTLICIYFYIDILQLAIGMCARGLGYNSVYSLQAIINALINAVFIFLLLYVGSWGLDGVLISTIIANTASFIFTSRKVKYFSYIHIRLISKSTLKELLAYSWPMVPNNLSNWVLNLSDRLVITGFLGVEANAVYAVANKIPKLLSEAQGVVVSGWQENASLAANDEDSDAYYTSMFHFMFKIIFSLTCLLIAATPIMFAVFIRGDYADAYVQIPLLIFGMFFYCMSGFLGGIYVAYKRTLNVAMTTIAAAAINLSIDLLLVNRIGITAGSVSTLVAYLALFLFRMFNVRRFKKMKYNYGRILLGVAVMAGLCFFTAQQNMILNCVNIIAAVLIAYFLNKDLAKKLLKKGVSMMKGRKK